jgi:hypothetical protein
MVRIVVLCYLEAHLMELPQVFACAEVKRKLQVE